ncbi:MAG: hypothetical protein NZ651_03285 [Candidatus Bipolaricaulota bacterium]|nr:hypothetical protein [Candidatus Bipolaricaulota bacterium]MDW8126777.1 hypothetical protein [Candidatus Bipolaricaulota bacterium]
MNKLKRVVIVWGLLSLPTFAVAQPCEIKVITDMWFRAMTEMASEKEYPEVIILENDTLQVWSVPNRGRIILDLVYKPTGHSQLFSERSPLPLKFRKLYTFEFGGIYSSFPWHKRDNVPLPLSVAQSEGGETCGVVMQVEDPETKLRVQTTISLLPSSAECLITTSMRNPTQRDQTINYSLIICARPGGYATDDTEVFVPIAAVKVGQSDGEWMGKVGSEVSWPTPWSRWGNFKGAGSFSLSTGALSTPEIIVYNPQTREELRLRWLPTDPWTSCEVFSWGPGYRTVMGAFDGFRIELQAENISLAPGMEQSLHLYVGVGPR